MGAAAGRILHFRHDIVGPRIQRQVRAQRPGQLQLALANVQRDDMQAHRLGILHGDMPQPADAGNGHPFARLRFGLLQPLVDGDARAQDRRHRHEIDAVGQAAGKGRAGDRIFGVGAVYAVAGIMLPLAQRFPAGLAIFARAAGIVQPGDAHGVALLQVGDTRTQCHDMAHALMAGDQRQARLHRPVAIDRVQIGMAHATGDDLHQHLAGPRLGYRYLLDRQRRLERPGNRGSHGRRHDFLLLLRLWDCG